MDDARERVIDELLVTRCQAGEGGAFDLLVRRWQRRLWSYARSLTGEEDAAWDAVQETWMAVLRQVRGLRDPAWFAAWVYRIVRNKCADRCRRADLQRSIGKGAAEFLRAKREAGEDEACEAVRWGLRQLPPEARELLRLRYNEGLTVVELAVVLGIPSGTVKSRLHYAREHLRRIMKGDDP